MSLLDPTDIEYLDSLDALVANSVDVVAPLRTLPNPYDDDDVVRVGGERVEVVERDPDGPLAGVDGFRYTDAGNAARLLSRNGATLRYVPLWRSWLAYDGRRWRLDHADTVVAHLAAEIGRELVEYVPSVYAAPDKLRPLLSAVRRAESAAGVAATLALASSVPGVAVDHEALDADPWKLNVLNGTVDLRTGHLAAHDPGDLLTLCAGAAYDPDASADRWHDLLGRVLPDPEVRGFVQRLAGLAMVGTQIEHVLVMGIGGGANGKSTITKIIAATLGEYAVVASRDLLLALKHDSHPTARSDLFRRRFAHSGELPRGARLDEAQVKELTGGDRIKARRMREDFWEFWPSHLLWLHANHKPTIEGTDDGIWRRVLLIPFDVQIPEHERDPHLAQRIIDDEASGVLRWMLDGLADYQANGLGVPDSIRAATSNYRTASDTVALFLAESGLVLDPAASIDTNELMALHGEWFATSGVDDAEKAHYQRVVEALKAQGARSTRIGKARTRGWIGVGEAP